MAYPTDLTTSDWLDYIARLTTRDEQIAALATFHRRVEYAAKQSTIHALSDPDDDANIVLQRAKDRAKAALPDYGDYISGVDTVENGGEGVIAVKP